MENVLSMAVKTVTSLANTYVSLPAAATQDESSSEKHVQADEDDKDVDDKRIHDGIDDDSNLATNESEVGKPPVVSLEDEGMSELNVNVT